ncbi:MAG: thioredoxin domain-containing protein [Thermoprotei archaeon]
MGVNSGTGGRKPNRLINETSPYLLQHAFNPVDWFPWGQEAFDKAKREDKPVFLSIGYSSCHWCHVMERECFEDPEVAELLNDAFVCIKVDREERPDVDRMYMAFCQATTGGGGWPLTEFLTPDGKPFYAATYIPKYSTSQTVGLMDLVPAVQKAWKETREQILRGAGEAVAELMRARAPYSAINPDSIFQHAFNRLAAEFDPEWGGFGYAPKFPVPHRLMYLLRYGRRSGNGAANQIVELTLAKMVMGGIHDQIGHGFHRYSTDRNWLVPHFEKMVYDQALMVSALCEAYQSSGIKGFAWCASETASFVLSDMTAPGGGFFSAMDADSPEGEGSFYLLTDQELRSVLTDSELQEFRKWMILESVEPGGTGTVTEPRKIVTMSQNLWEYLKQNDAPPATLSQALTKLREARYTRPKPALDEKILCDVNGLTIAAMSMASRVLDDDRFLHAATKSAEFVYHNMVRSGTLFHSYTKGKLSVEGFVDDYAFYSYGLFQLYQSTFQTRYLKLAVEFAEEMISRFWSSERNLFCDGGPKEVSANFAEPETYDGSVPSGNSVAAYTLSKLFKATGNSRYDDFSRAVLKSFGHVFENSPEAACFALCALDEIESVSREIALAGARTDPRVRRMVQAARKGFHPGDVILVVPEYGDERSELVNLAPYTSSMTSEQGAPRAYVCQNHSCNFPVTDLDDLERLLSH